MNTEFEINEVERDFFDGVRSSMCIEPHVRLPQDVENEKEPR